MGPYYSDDAWIAAPLVVLAIAIPTRTALELEGHHFWPEYLRRFANRIVNPS